MLPLAGIAAGSLIGSALGIMMVFFLQRQLLFTPSESGLILLCVPVSMMLSAQAGGLITDRYGPRAAAMAGAFTGGIGLFMLLPLNPEWTISDMVLRSAVIGSGYGMFASPVNVAVMAATPREYMGVGSAVSNLVRSLGFALGPAVVAMMWIPGETAISTASMQNVIMVLLTVQCLAFLSAIAYRKAD